MVNLPIFIKALILILLFGWVSFATGASSDKEQKESEATRVLQSAKQALLHIKVVGTDSAVEAASGSGFAVGNNGWIATNYHVVSGVVLTPETYRARYLAVNGKTGSARVIAIDIVNDLAILETDFRAPTPFQLSNTEPERGQAVYSLGFPNRQPATVTQGLYNGPVERRYVARFHFTGPINSGMSGGPALNSKGEVFGVNVESGRNQQLVSYLVPANKLSSLIVQALSRSSIINADEVGKQLARYGTTLIDKLLTEKRSSTQLGNYQVTGESDLFKCNGDTKLTPSGEYEDTMQYCSARANVWVSDETFDAGEVSVMYFRTRNLKMDAYRFAKVSEKAVAQDLDAQRAERGPYACRYKTVALKGIRSRAEICVAKFRQYDLADYIVNLISIDRSDENISITITLRALQDAPAKRFIKSILEGMAWAPATASKS